jgi:hypothetical protein
MVLMKYSIFVLGSFIRQPRQLDSAASDSTLRKKRRSFLLDLFLEISILTAFLVFAGSVPL